MLPWLDACRYQLLQLCWDQQHHPEHRDKLLRRPAVYYQLRPEVTAEYLKRHSVKYDNCDSMFSEKANLKRHKKGAVGKFMCDDCSKFFCTRKVLKGNKCDKLLLADKSDTSIVCVECYEVFTSRRALMGLWGFMMRCSKIYVVFSDICTIVYVITRNAV